MKQVSLFEAILDPPIVASLPVTPAPDMREHELVTTS